MGKAPFEEGLSSESFSAGPSRLTPSRSSHAAGPGHLPISSLLLSPRATGLLQLYLGSPGPAASPWLRLGQGPGVVSLGEGLPGAPPRAQAGLGSMARGSE